MKIFSKITFFYDQEKYFKYLGNKPLRFTPTVYKYWLDDFDLKKHYQIMNNLEKFITSRNYFYPIKVYKRYTIIYEHIKFYWKSNQF